MKSALIFKGATILGVSIEIRCSVEGFDLPTSVVLMAEIDRKAKAFARIDINGSPHENRPAVCGAWQHKDAGRTHFHDTELHANVPFDVLFNQGNDLPIARPIGYMPTDFSAAMEKCGELLHIEDLGEVEEPQWQPRQFPF